MQFEGIKRNNQPPNLTPLIDIVFLLLVFFLLTSSFVKEQVLDIQLPQVESGNEKQDDVLEITLSKDNHIYLQGVEITEQKLVALLHEKLALQKRKQVRLRGDQGADLKHIVAILDAARQAGASGVDLVTEQP